MTQLIIKFCELHMKVVHCATELKTWHCDDVILTLVGGDIS